MKFRKYKGLIKDKNLLNLTEEIHWNKIFIYEMSKIIDFSSNKNAGRHSPMLLLEA